MTGSIRPFRIAVAAEVLEDLRQRLERTRWPDEVDGAGWDYGTDTVYLRQLATYWRDGFDWPAREAELNRFEQYRAEVDGIGLHFLHKRGEGQHRIPLLLLHGWPSSFVQMLDIIPLLVCGEPAFDVVVPSLPGYGFSDVSKDRGMSTSRMARLLAKLMTDVLGYSQFAARGSDLGGAVLRQLALAQPDLLIGLHLSGTSPVVTQVPENLSPAEQTFVQNRQQWMQEEMAYFMLHSTKPQTLANGLNDSPAGLASWIIEKFRRWSDCGGNLESRYTKDEMLTNLTIYWVTCTINSSMRLYYETARDRGKQGYIEVPTGLLMSPHDMFPTPREWVERSHNVVHWRETNRGGHFLEWEEPQLVADDLREFFQLLRKRPVESARRYSANAGGSSAD
jgi:pimeloyl-ACP methyl ester carboxylesterase